MKNLPRTLHRLAVSSLFTLILTLFVVMILWRHIVITVPAGHAGVMWWRFFGGTEVTAPPKEEGVHMIFPWDKLILYDVRLQEKTTDFAVVANDGLSIRVTASIRWKARPKRLGRLHKTVGPDYLDRLVLPEVGSILRETIAKYKAVDLYASNRRTVQETIYQTILSEANGIGGRHEDEDSHNLVALLDILVTEVALPNTLLDAIERKFAQSELVEEYRFRVQREELESQRKEVEANGIRKFQETVAPAISDAYLRWSGIEATLKLAQSLNSKVVILGNGPGGLPVILNGFEGEKPPVLPEADPSNKPTPKPTPQATPAPPVPRIPN